jgi:hypothetical protein
MVLIDIFGVELVYNEIPFVDAAVSLVVVIFILITYLLRKIFPFNIIWGFFLAVFIYALINYVGGKLKKWINLNN